MHLVYKIIFTERRDANIKPYYYIGSKSNCVIKNGIMYSKNRSKEYWGSSNDKCMRDLIGKTSIFVEEIKWFDDYTECLKFEREIHIIEDVVSNNKYFNKSIAMENNFSNPNYATYKNVETNKIARLPKIHPDVLSGKWVGVSKGIKLSDEDRYKRSRKGESNPFYGKHHSEYSKELIRESKVKWKELNKEQDLEYRFQASERIKSRCLGVPKSLTQKEKMSLSGKNYISLKNIDTGECVRIKKDSKEYDEIDRKIWISPISYSKINGTITKIKCMYCDMIGTTPNINRWHNNNCKYKGK